MKFADMTVAQLLEALASPNPTPGGGTAAAVAGAMGTSLLTMVSRLAKSRHNADDEKAVLATVRDALTPLTTQLTRLADEDTDAFERVMAAYRLPKQTDDEKAARGRAIQAALTGATIVPLETLRACAAALAHAQVVAQHGNQSAASDTGVAIALLQAAADGALANVRINLTGLKDEAFTASTAAEATRLSSDASAHATAARQQLG